MADLHRAVRAAIRSRHRAGDTVEHLADDYGCAVEDVVGAIERRLSAEEALLEISDGLDVEGGRVVKCAPILRGSFLGREVGETGLFGTGWHPRFVEWVGL